MHLRGSREVVTRASAGTSFWLVGVTAGTAGSLVLGRAIAGILYEQRGGSATIIAVALILPVVTRLDRYQHVVLSRSIQ